MEIIWVKTVSILLNYTWNLIHQPQNQSVYALFFHCPHSVFSCWQYLCIFQTTLNDTNKLKQCPFCCLRFVFTLSWNDLQVTLNWIIFFENLLCSVLFKVGKFLGIKRRLAIKRDFIPTNRSHWILPKTWKRMDTNLFL